MAEQYGPLEQWDHLKSAAEVMHAGGATTGSMKSGFEFLAKEVAMEEKPLIARYKIQINFATGRTVRGPNVGVMTFWMNGSKLHGGGDELVHICKEVDQGTEQADFTVGKPSDGEGCGNIIEPDWVRGGVAFCPHCRRMIAAHRLTQQIYFKSRSRDIADELARRFRQFGNSADIVLRYADDDIRYQTIVRLLGAAQARESRGQLVYPLVDILKDTSGGSSLEDRFFAMVTS